MAGKIKALLVWCQKATAGYRDVNVTNMTTSWKDGMAFCALIHRYRPDLIDFDSLSKENVLHNNQLAFHTAEKELGIAALLDAEDMVEMTVPDKLSIITYVSQYYNRLHNMEVAPMPSEGKATTKRSASTAAPAVVNVKKKIVSTPEIKAANPVSLEKSRGYSTCEICRKKVHLVERFIDEGKIYHRQCHRTKSLSGMYKRVDIPQKNSKTSKAFGSTSDILDTTLSTNELHDNNKYAPEEPKKRRGMSDVSHLQLTNAVNNSNPTSNDVKRRSKVLEMANAYDKSSSPQRTQIHSETKVKNNAEETVKQPLTIKTHSEVIPDVDKAPSANQVSSGDNSSAVTTHETLKVELNKGKNLNSADKNDTSRQHLAADEALAKSLANSVKQSQGQEDLTLKSETVDSCNKASPPLTDHTKKEILPALLESLANARKREVSGLDQSTSSNEKDLSPTSAIAPLISELPTAPAAKPRSQTISCENPTQLKPIPRHRYNRFSGEIDLAKRSSDSRDNYDETLNPFQDFADEDAEKPQNDSKSAEKDNSYNETLNPFGEEEDDEASANEPLNPFGDNEEDDAVVPLTACPTKTYEPKIRSTTVNRTNPNDARLNPFTDEYEGRKQACEPPKPPLRRKNRAPTPPKPPPPKNPPSKPASSSPARSKSAPDWKQLEKKMEKMNQINQTDSKFVKKARKPEDGKSSKVPQKSVKSPKELKPTRRAPGFGFPLVKREVKSQMTEDEISNEMTILDIQLKDLEKKGVKLEEMLRDEMELEVESKPGSDHLLDDWIDLVQEKNKLVRRETDLVYLMQQQRLEMEHADVEFMIRKLMNKPESEKTKEDQEKEAQLVEQLVKIVERRNTIINSIEEARVKEELEDAALDELKEHKTDSSAAEVSGKKKKKKKDQDTSYDKVETLRFDSPGAEGSTKKKKGMKRIFSKKKGQKSPKQEEETPSST